MTDSENDLLPSNVFTFQNENTMISAKGPSVNTTNMTNLSFRNNVLTSTMHVPRNFERQRFGEPSFDQRSMYYRRETSPVSMYSGSDMRRQNYHQSFYGGGMSSQRSMYYGRSGSPMSMRSMDSNASVSAADIALAFKNVNFNKHDLRMIKEAYNKFMKRRIRKKIEKRRNMRLFLKGYRHKSGYDSGEQGSDSSISSDDCKSTSSAMYKDNMSCRSTRTDITDFRRSIKESNMYKDCTDSFRQNAFKNMFSVSSVNVRDRFNAPSSIQNVPQLPQKEFAVPNKPVLTQKDRFRSGYLLPSQRFNKSVASVPILERDPRLRAGHNAESSEKLVHKEINRPNGHMNGESDSEQEEIFSEVTVREKSTHNLESQYDKITDQGKRGLDMEDSNKCSDRKRPKLSSPSKQSNKANYLLKEKNTNLEARENKKINNKTDKGSEEKNKNEDKYTKCTGNKNTDEFEFVKPQFPVRKSGAAKIKEKLISKSAQPLTDEIISSSKPQPVEAPEIVSIVTAPKSPTAEEEPDTAHVSNNSDPSMRPSFIKRKLFTQKMDVTENKNLSNGAININSPQTNVYSAIHKEKHKARKLVTNQSCLSRDIAQEGNNLLDLIHKIVPPDRMNMTNVTNKTSVSCSISSKNPNNDDDKWDVTSVISTCNNDDVSDTYTDEEIFAADDTKRKENNVKNKGSVNKSKQDDKSNKNVNKPKDNKKGSTDIVKTTNECRILVEKLPPNKLPPNRPVEVSKPAVPNEDNAYNKKSIYNCVKSFWDTDFESDIESPAPKRPIITTEAVKENLNRSNVIEDCKNPKNKKTFNVSLASVSESIKSKTMPTNNLGKIKMFNISKTLSIKSFLTPKQVKPKAKIAKDNKEEKEVIRIKDLPPKHSNTDAVKKPVKQNANSKSAQNVDTEDKKADTKKKNGDLSDTPSKTQPQAKTKDNSAKAPKPVKQNANSKSAKNVNTENKKADTKKKNGDLSGTPSKTQPRANTKDNSAKTPKAKPINKAIANKSITVTRTVRTPKRKACCDENDNEHNKSTKSSATKSVGSKDKEKVSNANKKPKLVNYSPEKINTSSTRSKGTNKTNDSNKQKSPTNQPTNKLNDSIAKKSQKPAKNNKKVDQETKPEKPKNFAVETMNRTLRSRRIDLSSSINSSTENVTLQIRSLRTRRVDLSNSLKNSSLDESMKGPRAKTAKKAMANLNHTANNKKPRSAKNQTQR